MRARARRRDAAEEELTRTLGRTPTAAELGEHLGVPASELDAVEEDVQRAVVLSLQGFAEGVSVDDFVSQREAAPEDIVVHRERIGYLLDAVSELPDRLKTVVIRYFLEERPMADIADELGVSESRISQMRGEALTLLKDGLNAVLDPALLGAVGRPGGCAAAAEQALDDLLVVDLELHDRVELEALVLQDLAERTGLRRVAREPVEDEALLGVRVTEAVTHHADGDLVGDQVTRVHVALRLETELGLLLQVLPEEVAGRDVRDVQPLGHPLRLGSLARTRRTNQNESHVHPPPCVLPRPAPLPATGSLMYRPGSGRRLTPPSGGGHCGEPNAGSPRSCAA